LIGGGVRNNNAIQEKPLSTLKRLDHFIPPFEYTTDNAAMIGIVGYFK
jgi:N6-L-threonylcarbamoyladenine synthase